mmetsp:Transcript_29391/g.80335  ORF Transcript_29391/g.80335 Transcript_29391/m.80335 type:complete len:211 (+) Transcript_29391:882-1514(+)
MPSRGRSSRLASCPSCSLITEERWRSSSSSAACLRCSLRALATSQRCSTSCCSSVAIRERAASAEADALFASAFAFSSCAGKSDHPPASNRAFRDSSSLGDHAFVRGWMDVPLASMANLRVVDVVATSVPPVSVLSHANAARTRLESETEAHKPPGQWATMPYSAAPTSATPMARMYRRLPGSPSAAASEVIGKPKLRRIPSKRGGAPGD